MKVNMWMLAAQIVGMFVVFALVLFGAAGTTAWPAGWAFLAVFFGSTIAISLWLLASNPGLLTERMTGVGKADQKAWDKVFYAVTSVLFIGWLIIMPLDAVRYGWSHLPAWLQVAGATLVLVSFLGFFAAFRENSFLSPAVRIQSDRGHTVVSTGPYHYVRHPFYAAFLVFMVGTTLLMGSWIGLVPGSALVVAVARRAVLEERTLLAELPGYEAYMAGVRYRLVPYVW